MRTRLLLLLAALALAVSAQCATPTCGLTIITHGFQRPGSDGALPGWVSEMALAINARTGANLPIYRFRYDKDSLFGLTDYLKSNDKVVSENGDVDLAVRGGAIILLDWVGVSNEWRDYSAQDVADRFYKDLFQRLHSGRELASVPIHLIGHSRGASLNSRLAYRLAQSGILVEQVTTLDPHPVTSVGGTDWVPETFSNVVFADNYFQNEDFPDGQDVAGAYRQNLNLVINSLFPPFTQHQQIHTYYHGTIDLSARSDKEVDVELSWYQAFAPRAETGYNFSRFINSYRSVLGKSQLLIGLDGMPRGSGFRAAVGFSFKHWPNAGFDQGDDIATSIFVGETVDIPYYHASQNYDQTITFSLDEDTNPFNQGGSDFKPVSQTSRQDGAIQMATFALTPTTADIGTRFLRVKASNATGRSRYDYYFKPIQVLAAANSKARISTLTPRTLPVLTLPQTQRITIIGTDFTPNSTLSLFDGQSAIASIPGKLTFISPNELKYDIAVGTKAGPWEVKVLNGAVESAPFAFTVTGATDLNAPAAPDGLIASLWAGNGQISLDWTNPSDASGITKAWVKFGALPTSSSDGTAYPLPASKPLRLALPVSEGSRLVHLWLEDGAGNRSHNNLASISLGADRTSPIVQISSPAANPPPTSQGSVVLSGSYSDNLSGVASLKWHNFVSGTDGFVTLTGSPLAGTFTTPAIPLTPGLNGIGITATDAAEGLNRILRRCP